MIHDVITQEWDEAQRRPTAADNMDTGDDRESLENDDTEDLTVTEDDEAFLRFIEETLLEELRQEGSAFPAHHYPLSRSPM